MTTAATPLLGLALPVQGELSGTWGDVVNNSITSLVESAIAGTTTINSAATNLTLTSDNFAPNQARQAILLVTSSVGSTQTINVPDKSKVYVVINKTSSDVPVTVKSIYDAGVTVPPDTSVVIAWNGSAFVPVSGYTGLPVVQVTTNPYFFGQGDNGTLLVADGTGVVFNAGYNPGLGTQYSIFNKNASPVSVVGAGFYKVGGTFVTGLSIAQYGFLSIVYIGTGYVMSASIGVT
jgi:hypothetical protein